MPHQVPAIYAAGSHKSYRSTRALDGPDPSLRTGTVFGLLEPNGAGRTTAVHPWRSPLTTSSTSPVPLPPYRPVRRVEPAISGRDRRP